MLHVITNIFFVHHWNFHHTTVLGEDMHRFVRHKMVGKIVLNKVDKLSKNGFGNNYWRIYRNPDEYFVYLPFAAREKNITPGEHAR